MDILAAIRAHLMEYVFPDSRPVFSVADLPISHHSERDDTLALFDYTDPLVKSIIRDLKYRGGRETAEKLGPILYDTAIAVLEEKHLLSKWPKVVVIPMPLSAERHIERGYNQAELLAEALIAQDAGGRFLYLPHALEKVRRTEVQKTLARKERLENLRGSMSADRSVADSLVIVIDDVTTTGATFAEARRALKEAGTKKILCLALAH